MTESRSGLPDVVFAEEWQKTGRDVEHLGWDLSVLDLTALGRRQAGEDWPPRRRPIRAVSRRRVHNCPHVTTLMRDGSPHSVPMWVGVECRYDVEGCK